MQNYALSLLPRRNLLQNGIFYDIKRFSACSRATVYPYNKEMSLIIMDNKEKSTKDYYTIDLLHIVKALWKRVWIIVLCGILGAGALFSYSAFVLSPQYASSIMLYVNNNVSIGNMTITTSQITAAQSLVKTYTEILKTRTTLEMVIESAGVDYTYQQLVGMIEAAPANETEIMKVTVTTNDPYVSAEIAKSIAEVLPRRLNQIIDGASMEVVDDAIPNLEKVAPSVTNYTFVGLLLGVLLSAVAVAVIAMLDDTIHDEEYVIHTYDYPILAKVPNLLGESTKKYGYYSRYGHYGHYGHYGNNDRETNKENAENASAPADENKDS